MKLKISGVGNVTVDDAEPDTGIKLKGKCHNMCSVNSPFIKSLNRSEHRTWHDFLKTNTNSAADDMLVHPIADLIVR